MKRRARLIAGATSPRAPGRSEMSWPLSSVMLVGMSTVREALMRFLGAWDDSLLELAAALHLSTRAIRLHAGRATGSCQCGRASKPAFNTPMHPWPHLVGVLGEVSCRQLDR